jgi:hypothetical protein
VVESDQPTVSNGLTDSSIIVRIEDGQQQPKPKPKPPRSNRGHVRTGSSVEDHVSRKFRSIV